MTYSESIIVDIRYCPGSSPRGGENDHEDRPTGLGSLGVNAGD